MCTLNAGWILIESIEIVCRLNLMACESSWAHRPRENAKHNKRNNNEIKNVGPNVERLC